MRGRLLGIGTVATVLLCAMVLMAASAAAPTTQQTSIVTQLTVGGDLTSVVNQLFTINGTLRDSNGGIAGATITLQESRTETNPRQYQNVDVVVTNANGEYSFSVTELTAGMYVYRTTYAGNTTYAPATSNDWPVQVNVLTTKLTAVASNTTVWAGDPIYISGTLRDSNGGMARAIITLQVSLHGKGIYENVIGATAITNASGSYNFITREYYPGIYDFRTTYAGTSMYASATSNVVIVYEWE